MKRIIFSLLLIVVFFVGQAISADKKILRADVKTLSVNCTVSGIYDTTVVFSPTENTHFGDLIFEVHIAQTTDMVDSIRFRGRPGYAIATTSAYTASDGDTVDWDYFQMYDGGNIWTDFDWTIPITDADVYLLQIEMGGVSWPEVIMNVQHYDKSDSTSVGTIYIYPYEH